MFIESKIYCPVIFWMQLPFDVIFFFQRNAMTETTLDSAHSEHIFVIQQYKDEILELQKKCFEKDRIILERDKKVSVLK